VNRGSSLNRTLDRYIGVPLVATAGLLHHSRALPSRVNRIGLLSATALGDTLLLAGLTRDVKRQFPASEVVLICGHTNRPAAALLPGVDHVLSVPLTSPIATVKTLRGHGPFNVLLDFSPWSRLTALYVAASGSQWTGGFKSDRQLRHFAYDAWALHSSHQHEIQNYRDLARLAGIVSESQPEIFPSHDRSSSRTIPEGRTIVFHPWASGAQASLREWPEERWLGLAHQLASSESVFVITGGPGDQNRSMHLSQLLNREGLRAQVFEGSSDLRDLAALLADSSLVVSVNTGVMHLAALTGARTVSLNGPTSPLRWGPLGRRVVSINAECPGCGYLNFGFEFRGQRRDCMLQISVKQVLDGIHLAFGDWSQQALIHNVSPPASI
jgi:heptosyltransferase III